MATVHLARQLSDEGFSRVVAVKRLHAHVAESPESLGMFLDEARLASRIRHSHVVPTLDVVSRDGELLIVMEYILGESLSSLMRNARAQGESVPVPIAVRIAIDTLHGLHAAHLATDEHGAPLGIVHRDVSPQNILIGVDGVSRIVDFGIAKAAGRLQTTQNNKLKGKLAYMAPEQLERKHELDSRVDVYATCIVLWELLSDQRLFRGEDEIQTFRKALNDVVVSPAVHQPDLPEALCALVLKGLARDRNARPASARELARGLEELGIAARSSDLADWVNRIASDSLDVSRARLAELEKAPALHDLAEAPLGSASSWSETTVRNKIEASLAQSEAATDMIDVPGEGTHTATVTISGGEPRKKRGWWPWAAAALALLTVAGLTLNAGQSREASGVAAEGTHAPSAQGDSANESESQQALADTGAEPAPAPSTDSPPPDKSQAEPATDLADLPAEVSQPNPTPTPAAPPRARPRSRPQAAPQKKASVDDCANPFTVDKDGVRVPKVHCL